jgi:hypothetical protein
MAENNKLPILPTAEDFAPGGALEGIVIPDMYIPKEVVKFMFGDENHPMTKAYTFKLLTYLHEVFHWDVQYCDCLEHMVYKRRHGDGTEMTFHLTELMRKKYKRNQWHNNHCAQF